MGAFVYATFTGMRLVWTWLFTAFIALVAGHGLLGQQTEVTSDDFFLEDLFYAGVTYNILTSKPEQVIQRSLSYTVNFGAFREWGLSRNRKVSVAQGIGYSVSAYYTNIGAMEGSDGLEYEIIPGAEFRRSKITAHAVELPFELRFRGATRESYRFWRFHLGITYSYVFDSRWMRVDDSGRIGLRNTDIRRSQWGLTGALGYNTFNLRAYCGLSPILLDNAVLGGQPISVRNIGVGVIFYIL